MAEVRNKQRKLNRLTSRGLQPPLRADGRRCHPSRRMQLPARGWPPPLAVVDTRGQAISPPAHLRLLRSS
eukprot:15039377-Alexandrium_andersonii.AAC.1